MWRVLRLEAQRMRSHHSSVLHRGCRDGPQIFKEFSGIAGAQSLDVAHYSLISLRDKREQQMK